MLSRRNMNAENFSLDKFPLFSKPKLKHLLLIFISLTIVFLFGCVANGDDKFNNLTSWVGRYPIQDSQNFLKEKPFSVKLPELVGADIYNRLVNLENKPYYLLMLIKLKNNFLILEYPANGHFNSDEDSIFLFINTDTKNIHFAQIIDNKIFWKHGESVDLPQEIRNFPSRHLY